MAKHPSRPRDANQLAKRVVDLATGAASEDKQPDLTPVQEHARAMGLKGGQARREALSPERRAEIAKKAAQKRWQPSRD